MRQLAIIGVQCSKAMVGVASKRFKNRSMRHHVWRQFRSYRLSPRHRWWRRRRFAPVLDKATVTYPQHRVSPKLYSEAEAAVVALLQRRPQEHDLDRFIDRFQKRFQVTNNPYDGLVSLLVQAPRAVFAQRAMDVVRHGYRNKHERRFELIDFNDTIVSTILGMPDDLRALFETQAKQSADRICKSVHAPCFTNEQWEAIIRGLTREVALYRAARDSGFHAWMTDRAHDALGVDMQIQDPETKRYVNIDVKTPSSFRYRMETLVHEGRLTARELLQGDERGYIVECNGHGDERVRVVVLAILPERYGELRHWRFVDVEPVRHMLNQLIRNEGINDGKYGELLQK